MIKKLSMEIVAKEEIAQDTVEMVLQNEYVSKHAMPGQFLHISIENHTLRRPISIASINEQTQTATILYKKIGSGTDRLAQYKIGEELDVLGPSGGHFPVDLKPNSSVLLIGGGIGVPPIYYLGRKLAQAGMKVQAILGFQSKQYVFYEEQFKKLGDTYIATNDGSYGQQGFVTDVIPQVQAFDRYYACGPQPMLKAVKDTLRGTPGFLSFEERMACGVGACFSCVIPTETEAGYKKICQDGPVFAANEVIL